MRKLTLLIISLCFFIINVQADYRGAFIAHEACKDERKSIRCNEDGDCCPPKRCSSSSQTCEL